MVIHALALVFFAYVFGISMKFPLNDPDMWWHLKTGEQIVQSVSLPDEDLFSHTAPSTLTQDQLAGLRSQWLGQVLFYGAYSVGGLGGVAALRGLLVLLPLIILYVWFIRKGLAPFNALMITALPAIALSVYLHNAFERPQAFSFTLALIAVMLLESLRERMNNSVEKDLWPMLKKSWHFIALPLVMALWSNAHGGFIAGVALVALYAIGEAASYIFKRDRNRNATLLFIFFCVIAIIGSFINPNTYNVLFTYTRGLFVMLLSGTASLIPSDGAGGVGVAGWVASTVREYKPLVHLYKDPFFKWLVYYWLFAGSLLALMSARYIVRRRVDAPELLAVGFVLFFAQYHSRGLMFSLVLLPLYMGKNLLTGFDLSSRIQKAIPRVASALLVLIVLGLVVHTARMSPGLLMPGVAREHITEKYPSSAVEFLKAVKAPGNMYNYYSWGGYLIWTLHPGYKVFADGRALDDKVLRTSHSIVRAEAGWQEDLKAHDVNLILIPVVYRGSGGVVPLAAALAGDNGWRLIFIKDNSAVFIKDAARNRNIIGIYNRPKEALYKEALKFRPHGGAPARDND